MGRMADGTLGNHPAAFWVLNLFSVPEMQAIAVLRFEEVARRRNKKSKAGASLVVQWLRTRLSMQGTQVRALVWEDPTCHGATKPVRHNY